MIPDPNHIATSELAALQQKAGARVSSAIQKASEKTGIDFSYLLQQAQVESSFKFDAKAKTSSASGLYQFIESTWIKMVDKYGDKYGLNHYADKINASGKVEDQVTRAEILKLRNDPEICALMAGEFASENKNYLQNCINGDVGATELYMAHFMGAGGAAKFLNQMENNPAAIASKLFPDAARANKNIFYHKDGTGKSLAEVYEHFDRKFALVNSERTTSEDQRQASGEAMFIPAIFNNPVNRIEATKLYTSPTNYNDSSNLNILSTTTEEMGQTSPIARDDSLNPGSLPKVWWSSLSPLDFLELLKDNTLSHRA